MHFLFSNSVNELHVPLCLPEIKTLDVSKNNVESVSAHFLAKCPRLETLNVSMNKICECLIIFLFNLKTAFLLNVQQILKRTFYLRRDN